MARDVILAVMELAAWSVAATTIAARSSTYELFVAFDGGAFVADLERRGFATYRDGDMWLAATPDNLARVRTALSDEPGNYYSYRSPLAFVIAPGRLVAMGIVSRTSDAELCRELFARHLPATGVQRRCNPHRELAPFVLDDEFTDVTDRSELCEMVSVGADNSRATRWSRVDDFVFVAPLGGTFDLGELGFLLLACGFQYVTATRFLPPGSAGGMHSASVELSPTEITFDVAFDTGDDILAGCHAFAAKLFALRPCTARAHRETSYNYDPLKLGEIKVWRTPIVADDIFPPATE
jgi:hypothetical protein